MSCLTPVAANAFKLARRIRAVRKSLAGPGPRDELAAVAQELISLAHDVHKLEDHLERIHLACDRILPPPPPASSPPDEDPQ